ncbi:uncharacterized protein MONOS_15398 [Monocercomonoides exilis]|uniref:uncharacterized protein n=1 Tax=Monocercomonoides exilis TaxID=2049356 RepID=UPI00355A392B|nr:hypothetical protein MONOS_15398 [Monocercomonoides exilis]|eukprot:MONOS_15398.1-p1 / transcript=MONOS_15398.1 / gene=MONOS_15398 / organism=Monocercomonoides_exilis_PA203 / gene_product=unspecified product / transcript_product=unspecified product / location=Mono_scaffold01221:4098-6017(-) / protein_length=597 / sequence_SO=supercontig / SO=protein_coding / is_pseudo=false
MKIAKLSWCNYNKHIKAQTITSINNVKNGVDRASANETKENLLKHVTIYVGQSGTSDANGETFETPVNTLGKANTLLTGDPAEGGYHIKVISTGELSASEAVAFDKEKGVTVVGVAKQENDDGTEIETEAKATIVCSIGDTVVLFTCTQTVEFREISFKFGTLIGTNSLICATTGSTSLRLISCDFVRPTPQTPGGNGEGDESQPLGTTLVKVEAGTLTMETVIGTATENPISFSTSPFLITGVTKVSLKDLQLSEITSKTGPLMKIASESAVKMEVSLDGCSFTKCASEEASADTATSGALYVESEHAGSSFTIGDTATTTFTSCACAYGKSGGIYLKMTGIIEANKLAWPDTESNLVFSGCTAGSKSTGLYLDVPVNLHEEIAVSMKCGFASSYIRGTNDWYVAAKGPDGCDVDFTATYFDPEQPPTPPTPISVVYLKCDANDTGLSFHEPIGSFSSSYNLFTFSSSLKLYSMRIIADDDMIKAEAMIFDRSDQLTIEGIENTEGMNQYANIDCDVGPESNLFTCKKSVTFKYLSFVFPLSLSSKGKSQFVKVTDSFALIISEGVDAKLAIIHCRFIRPHENESEKENVVDFHL